jgi:hypothetical protein
LAEMKAMRIGFRGVCFVAARIAARISGP